MTSAVWLTFHHTLLVVLVSFVSGIILSHVKGFFNQPFTTFRVKRSVSSDFLKRAVSGAESI